MSGNLKSTPEDRAAVLGNSWHGDGYKAPTPAVVDHKAEAERILAEPAFGYAEANDPHGAAQTHALLALVEQVRLSTLARVAMWNDEALSTGAVRRDDDVEPDMAEERARVDAMIREVREGVVRR